MSHPGGSFVCAAALGALVWVGCASDRGDPGELAAVAKLERDTHALKRAVLDAREGRLIRPGNVVIGVQEDAVRELFTAVLPLTRTIERGARTSDLTLRVDRAYVQFDGGLGTVRVEGRAWLSRWPSVAADFTVSGGFAEARIAPEEGVLHARVGLDTLDARPIPGGLLARIFRGDLLRSLNVRGREEISGMLPELQVPVRLEQRVRIPDLDRDPVHVRGGILDVTVTFTRMWASDGRLWLQFEPKLGGWRRNGGRP